MLGFRALTGVLLVSILAACGQSTNGEQNKPASQVFADATKAMLQLKSFQELSKGTNIVLSPSRGGGTLTTPIGTWDVVTADGFVFVKANTATWHRLFQNAAEAAAQGEAGIASMSASEAESEAQSVAGKWVKAPASNPYVSEFAGLGESRNLPRSPPSSLGSLSKRSGTTDVNGTKAVTLVFSRGTILYVADSGPPYMLKSNEYSAPSSGSKVVSTITYDEFGTAVIPSVPTGAMNLPTS